MIILSQYVSEYELSTMSRFLTLEDVLEAARKVLKGLATEIKSPKSSNGCRFFKVRLGKKKLARIITFITTITTESKKVVPVLIRLKKDKIFGENMAMNNKVVEEKLNMILDHVLEDIKEKRYQEFF